TMFSPGHTNQTLAPDRAIHVFPSATVFSSLSAMSSVGETLIYNVKLLYSVFSLVLITWSITA
ncbi:hypothetical protein P7M35_25140, partial [Vibrio parahaemolyticus]|nr:hypothetical protein [Vibrio parahaemolyticus]